MFLSPSAGVANRLAHRYVGEPPRNLQRRDVLHLQARLATHSKSRHEIDVGAGNQPWLGELPRILSFMPGFQVAY